MDKEKKERAILLTSWRRESRELIPNLNEEGIAVHHDLQGLSTHSACATKKEISIFAVTPSRCRVMGHVNSLLPIDFNNFFFAFKKPQNLRVHSHDNINLAILSKIM